MLLQGTCLNRKFWLRKALFGGETYIMVCAKLLQRDCDKINIEKFQG